MNYKTKTNSQMNNPESGAALVTVIMISVLLLIAIVALLSSVGANSKNSTDVLSEVKANYAAESGLQAAINKLRNDSTATYSAVAGTDMATWLPYSSGKVPVGTEASYTINVTDPDNSSSQTTFTTSATFATTAAGPWVNKVCFPNCATANRIEISYVPPVGAPVTITHPGGDAQSLGSFKVDRLGTGTTTIPITQTLFRIDYQMTDPRPAVRTIRGTILAGTTANSGTWPKFSFNSYKYSLAGRATGSTGTIGLCSTSACTTSGVTFTNPTMTMPIAGGTANTSVYAKIAAIEPYRLRVTSTGYGPNGARKILESVIQRNYFNDISPPAAVTLIGPGSGMVFNTWLTAFIGFDSGDTSVAMPIFAVSDTDGLTKVGSPTCWRSAFDSCTTDERARTAPVLIGNEAPDWLANPATLDLLINKLRKTARNSNRLKANGATLTTGNFGDYNLGTGLTFCDGDCTLAFGDSGGGLLIVTGELKTYNLSRFKGLILVTGQGGIQSAVEIFGIPFGGVIVTGNVVVAPYNSNNLSTWLSPRYEQNIEAETFSNVEVNDAFNGTTSVTDFMLGIAEK